MLIGILSFIVNIVGVFLLLSKLLPSMLILFIIIGGSLGLLENIIGIKSGEQNSIVTLIISVIICFIVFNGKFSWWQIILIGSMFESLVMGFFSIPMYMIFLKKLK